MYHPPWLMFTFSSKTSFFLTFCSIIAQPKRCLFRIQTSVSILCCHWKCFMAMAQISGSSTRNALKWSQSPPRRSRAWRMPIVSFKDMTIWISRKIDNQKIIFFINCSLCSQRHKSCLIQPITFANGEHEVPPRWQWKLPCLLGTMGSLHHTFA